jgi:uncharacterized Rmd1/YagE family protein
MAPHTVSVQAYSFAAALAPKRIIPCLPEGATVRMAKTQAVAQYGDERLILMYDFGAIVFIGVDDEARQRVMNALLQIVGPEPHPPLQETLTIEIGGADKPGMKDDHIVAPTLTRGLAELAAFVVAQSAAMEYYEEDVDEILAKLNAESEQLAKSGRLRPDVRRLLQFIGSGMSTHNQVVFTLSLLDTPQLAWDDDALDRVYRALRGYFEIEDRFRALEHKLNMIQNNFEVLAELTQERRSYSLEVIVAVLVALEVVLFVYEIVSRR